MATLLSGAEVSSALGGLSDWTGDPGGIQRAVEAPSFLAGIDLVAAVAQAAEAADHHPDIDIRWRTVTFRLSTHSEGGVTRRDIDLAAEIDRIVTRAA